MKKNVLIASAIAAAAAVGIIIGSLWKPVGSIGEPEVPNGERQILYWKAPMDPNYRSDKPGKSPMGMDLVPVYAGETAEEDEGIVVISPRIVNNLGVRTAPADYGVLSRRVNTVG